MVFKKQDLPIHQAHYFIINIGRHIGNKLRYVHQNTIDYICFPKYLSCYHSALMELAGFILEALTACQLTVITAMVSDNNKDMIKVQKGKSMR